MRNKVPVGVLLAIASISVTVSAAAQAPLYFPVKTLTAGANPASVAVGDFDEDGRPDVATANYGAGNVTVTLAAGVEMYPSGWTIPVGTNPKYVAVGDLNHDAHADLVVANFGSGNVSVLLGDGTGQFSLAVKIPVGSYPTSVAISDVNGDAIPDLAIARNWYSWSNPIVVLLGNGGGGFGPPTSFAAGYYGDFLASIAVGDLNGDGRMDLAVAGSSDVEILLGDGAGGFGAPASLNWFFGVPNAIAIADLNGDLIPDLSIADYYATWVVLGNGTGGFSTPSQTFGSNSAPLTLALADVNADGELDVVTSNFNTPSISTFFGDGAGGLAIPVVSPAGGLPTAVALGDMNEDGRIDAVVAGGSDIVLGGNVALMFGNGETGFSAPENHLTAFQPDCVAVGDLNGDYAPDIVVGASGGKVATWTNTGTGSYGALSVQQIAVHATDFAIADWTGDGKADVAVAGGQYDLLVFAGDGAGGIGNQTSYPVTGGSNHLARCDLDHDSTLDLVITTSANTVSILRGLASGGFAPETTAFVGSGQFAIGVADLNGDGDLDIAVTGTQNNVVVLLGLASGGFGAPSSHPVGSVPLDLAIADLDADGAPDIVTCNESANSVSILRGDGNGGFAAAIAFNAGPYPHSVAIGELNGDERPDIAVAPVYSGQGTTILLNLGYATFSKPVSYPTGWIPAALEIADVDRDSRPDLVVANLGSNDVSVLRNQTCVAGRDFTDGFEGGALGPPWATTAVSGSISPTTSGPIHSGVASIATSVVGPAPGGGAPSHNVNLLRYFCVPTYGTASVWFYDTGPNATCNAALSGAALNVGVSDPYHYTYWDPAYSQIITTIPRTQGWHQFAIRSTPAEVSVFIDGTQVYYGYADLPFHDVSLQMYTWSGPWTYYWDDFSFDASSAFIGAVGTGCAGLLDPPKLTATVPKLSGTFTMTLVNAGLGASGVLFLGTPASGPLAVKPGCQVYFDAGAFLPLLSFTTDGLGTWAASLALPSDPVLVGFDFVLQAGVPPVGGPLRLSNGVTGELGY